jgi:hypothetical protein
MSSSAIYICGRCCYMRKKLMSCHKYKFHFYWHSCSRYAVCMCASICRTITLYQIGIFIIILTHVRLISQFKNTCFQVTHTSRCDSRKIYQIFNSCAILPCYRSFSNHRCWNDDLILGVETYVNSLSRLIFLNFFWIIL